jgi:hypothetical protein
LIFHFTTSEETKKDVYALPLPSNSVCNGPKPGFLTSPYNAASYFITGIPSKSPAKFFAAIAFCNLSKLKPELMLLIFRCLQCIHQLDQHRNHVVI